MTFVRKFSQFVPEAVTSVVGLTAGANSIGPNGGGGGAAITYTFTQSTVVSPALYLGAAVRVDEASGLWELCLGTTPLLAEFYAFIVAVSGDMYTVQFAGEVPPGVPFLTGLIAGTPYYLSDTIAGGISATPPAILSEVNLPVLWGMDNGNSVIKMSRGYVIGAGIGSGGGGGSPPNNTATVVQPGNMFPLGAALYLASDNTFALANAYSTLAAAQAEWVVTGIPIANNTFTIQQGGQIKELIATDDMGAPIDSGPIYYISPIVGQEGKLTATSPTGVGQFSKPFYIQQVASSLTGWLLDQRPQNGRPSGSIFLGYLNAANNFDSTAAITGFPFGFGATGFKAYQLIMNTEATFPGTGGIRATGPNPISIGLQVHDAGGWVNPPNGGNSYYTYGINSLGTINPGPGTSYAQIQNDATNDSMILMPPIGTTVDFTGLEGILTVIESGTGFGANFQWNGFFIDNSNVLNPNIGYVLSGGSLAGSIASVDGIRVYFGGGATVSPGSQSYIAVYGIPFS